MRIAAFGCTHVPLNDRDYEDNFLLPELERFQPDVIVHLGDLFEAQHASRWEKLYDFTIDDEYEAASAYIAKIDAVCPDARKVFIMGNHDANFINPSRVPMMYGKSMDWRDQLPGHWEQVTRDYVNDMHWGCWAWGQIVFTHGYLGGDSADKMQALEFAMTRGAHHLLVSAHTHRPVPVTRVKAGVRHLPCSYTNPGCGRDLKPVYVKRDTTSRWGQGITLIEAEDWRYMDGFVPREPLWQAETRVYRFGHGYAPDQADIFPRES